MAARTWTPEQREKQRQAIQRWQPWAQSTGPVSAQGKSKSSRNAAKGGLGAKHRQELRRMKELLRDFRRAGK